MRLFKSRFFLIAFLPNIIFAGLLLLQILMIEGIQSPNNYPKSVFAETGMVTSTFFYIRNILLLGYILGAVYLIYEYLQTKKKNNKTFIRSLIIVGAGALLSQFALFLALLPYSILTRIFG